jgi:hypothetical protein
MPKFLKNIYATIMLLITSIKLIKEVKLLEEEYKSSTSNKFFRKEFKDYIKDLELARLDFITFSAHAKSLSATDPVRIKCEKSEKLINKYNSSQAYVEFTDKFNKMKHQFVETVFKYKSDKTFQEANEMFLECVVDEFLGCKILEEFEKSSQGISK